MTAQLWLLAARLEVASKNYTRARSILERGRTVNPNADELWLEAVRVEQARDSHLDLNHAPYALYGVKYIDLVSLWLEAVRVEQAREPQ